MWAHNLLEFRDASVAEQSLPLGKDFGDREPKGVDP
jgi:hypothetical protein